MELEEAKRYIKSYRADCKDVKDKNIRREVLFLGLMAKGIKVIPADDYTLQLDLDTEEAYEIYLDRYEELLGKNIKGITEKPSMSGLPKRHITIKLVNPMNEETRILHQALLGSDITREFLNYKRVINGVSGAIVFFEL